MIVGSGTGAGIWGQSHALVGLGMGLKPQIKAEAMSEVER